MISISALTTNSAVIRPVPYACAQPYHPGSDSHGQLDAASVPAAGHFTTGANPPFSTVTRKSVRFIKTNYEYF